MPLVDQSFLQKPVFKFKLWFFHNKVFTSMSFLKLLKSVLLMHDSIHLLQEVIERHTGTTVMALEVGIIFDLVDISPCLIFVFL